MSAAVRTAQPTCALVFAEETLIRRNGIPQKLAERGLLIKKQVAANSRAFEFSTVDLVIVIADGVTSGQSSVIRAAAKYANVDVLFLPHQASRWGEALHGYASAPCTSDSSRMQPVPHVPEPTMSPGLTSVPRDAFEFHLLFGIERAEQVRLAREGHRVKTLISYGEQWFPWYMRRLAERPANLAFVAKSMFSN